VASLDQRTKSDCDIVDIDIHEHCTAQLPTLLLEHGERAARGLHRLGRAPLALEVDGWAYTFAADASAVVCATTSTRTRCTWYKTTDQAHGAA
jgi:hypothetical protein